VCQRSYHVDISNIQYHRKPVLSAIYHIISIRCDMSSISLLNKIEFAILQNVQYHYILWSAPFQFVNPKVNNPYIYLSIGASPRKTEGYILQPSAVGFLKNCTFCLLI